MGNRKLPFGYKMVMGEIVVHPQEAQAVQGIYARYLAGASFNDITDHLNRPTTRTSPGTRIWWLVFWRTTATPVQNDFRPSSPRSSYRKLPSAGQSVSLRCR